MSSYEEQIIKYQNRINELQRQIDNSTKQYNAILDNKIRRIKAVMKTMSDKQIYDMVVSDSVEDKLRIDQDNISNQFEIEKLNKLIEKVNDHIIPKKTVKDGIFTHVINPSPHKRIGDYIEEIYNNSDKKQMYDLVHTHIKSIKVIMSDTVPNTKVITIDCYNEKRYTYYYAYRAKSKDKQIFTKNMDNEIERKIYDPMKYVDSVMDDI
jgi:hypothetical protein